MAETDEFSLILAASVHDMKNSLGMLLGSLEQVIDESEAMSERQAQQFSTLQYEASRINGELIQLLSIYRMQKNRMPIAIDEHYVGEVLDEQLARNDTLFRTRGVEVSLQCNDDLIWYFDSDLVASVINDALVNCARYTKDKVRLSAEVVDDCLILKVEDNGRGFPEPMLGTQCAQSQATVFDQSRTNLGLYFAARVAAMHTRETQTGHLKLANGGSLGGGEFTLVLP